MGLRAHCFPQGNVTTVTCLPLVMQVDNVVNLEWRGKILHLYKLSHNHVADAQTYKLIKLTSHPVTPSTRKLEAGLPYKLRVLPLQTKPPNENFTRQVGVPKPNIL